MSEIFSQINLLSYKLIHSLLLYLFRLRLEEIPKSYRSGHSCAFILKVNSFDFLGRCVYLKL